MAYRFPTSTSTSVPLSTPPPPLPLCSQTHTRALPFCSSFFLFSPARQARALEWVRADHPDQRFVIAGHSIGARIIFELQQSHPACCRGHLLVSYGVGLHCVQPEPYWRIR